MNDDRAFPPLPKCIAEKFEQISHDVSWIHARWIIYKQLFAHSEKRIDLLNQCAPNFFMIMQRVLIDDVLLALNRLADRATTQRYERLSLEWIATRLREVADEDLLASTHEKLASFREQCQPFKTHRNKRLAHRDLQASLASNTEPLPGITLHMIDNALAIVRDYLNAIEGHFCDSRTDYETFLMVGDANSLISHLAQGLRCEELWRSGTVPYDDFDKSEWHDA